MLPPSRISNSLPLFCLIVPSALAAFQYVDSSCAQFEQYGGIQSGVDESIRALNAAITALHENGPLSARIGHMMTAMFGEPPSVEEANNILEGLKGIYEAKLAALGPTPNNIYVYCGDSVIWSDYKPDPDRPECIQQFDPRQTDGGDCGVDVQDGDNVDVNGQAIPGFWYAPNPFLRSSISLPNGFANPGKWTQLIGIDGEDNVGSGESFCSVEITDAVTFSKCDTPNSGLPVFMVLCEETFKPPADKPTWVNTNTNIEYWRTPDAPGATLDAHQGSLSFHMIHELGHALCSSNDQLLQDGATKAYEWARCIELAGMNRGKTAAANTAWKNCDSQAFFAIAMLMDKCDWSTNNAKEPSKTAGSKRSKLTEIRS